MQVKQRLLSAIRGEPIDRVPWSPFLAYWWEAQPESITKRGMLSFLESVGADPLLRGFGTAWQIDFKGVEKRTSNNGNDRIERLETPVGTLSFGYRYSSVADSWFLADHPVENIDDLKTLMWIYEHASIDGNSNLSAELNEIGDRALTLPLVGSEMKTCFQSMIEKYVGTVNLTYLLADEPEAVDECLQVMRKVSDRTADFSAESDGEAFIFWEDSSTTNISPAFFEKYAAPEIKYWGECLRACGKLLIHHACGHLRALLPSMAQLPIDAVESLSPPPTGNIDIANAQGLLPEQIAIIGGIEPVFFENCSLDELDTRVRELLHLTKGRRYILANSDSCPPGVAVEKFKFVSNLLSEIPLL